MRMTGLLLGRVALLTAIFGFAAWGQAPTSLTVKGATSKKIDLSWSGTASGYTVQRASLGGAFSNIATPTTTTYSDTTIDAYTTYQYQIVANLVSGASTPSAKVTVGPPPAGFNVAAQAPGASGGPSANNYGYDLTMTLDGNGDPAFAFAFQDPNNTNDYTQDQILFRSWNRATYSWNPVVKVATNIGDIATYFHNSVDLAYDASTGNFAVFTEYSSTTSQGTKLFTSADGVTWTPKATYAAGNAETQGTAVSLAGGNVYLASIIDNTGVRYVSGKLSADPATWQVKTAPVPANTYVAGVGCAPALALDSAGNPGIAYWVGDTRNGYNAILLYWRPASSNPPTVVMDSQNQQSDLVAVRMVYHNLNPRIAVYVARLDAGYGLGDHIVKSDDGGATWRTPIVVTPDGTSSTDFPFDLAVNSQDQGAFGFGQNGGSGDTVCPAPKLALSNDLATWKTCGLPGADSAGTFSVYPGAIALVYGGNDKLYYAWWETEASPAGIYLYREPPAGSSNTPSVSTVVNGATFQSGIVAGSWTTITGVNLAGVSRTWQDSDFSNGSPVLPTSLSGVSVKINGLNAPVYYISPSQIDVQAPSGISGTVPVVVTNNGASSTAVNATAVANAPGLFTYALGGYTFPSALYNGTVTIVGDPALYGAAAKAKAGDIIQLYATGLGASPAGNIIGSNITFNGTVTASIGTAAASVQFAGLVGVGLFQVNIIVPSGLADGLYQLLIKANGVSSQTGVVIPITH